MTLTRFQIHERLGSLAGELKAARELDGINADTLAAKEHERSLAVQAKEKSEANITRLEEEARKLASQYASSVEELICGPGDDGISIAADSARNVDGTPYVSDGIDHPPANAFASPLYENGVTRLNAVFDEATHP